MVFGQDADFTDEAILTRYNADLANDLGNLVSRATTMIHRYCGGVVPAPDASLLARDAGSRAAHGADDVSSAASRRCVESFQLSAALRDIWDLIGAINRYIVAREPWKLAKDADQARRARDGAVRRRRRLRVIAELLRPFMPDTGERTLEMLGVAPSAIVDRPCSAATLDAGHAASAETRRCFRASNSQWRNLQKMASDPTQPAPRTAAPGTTAPAAPAHRPAPPAPAPPRPPSRRAASPSTTS